MISKMLLSGATAAPEFGVSISPSNFGFAADNGSYTTPRFTANLVGATSAYEFKWGFVGNSFGFSILGSDENDYCVLNGSGVNSEIDLILKCDVTDTSTSAVTTATAQITIFFESNL